MSNFHLQKDSSFNRSFEREHGYNLYMLGPNKSTSNFSILKKQSLNNNNSIGNAFNPFSKEHDKKNMNLFVEMAEDNNDKNDNDYINLNLFQKGVNSITRPIALRDKSAISNFSMNVS